QTLSVSCEPCPPGQYSLSVSAAANAPRDNDSHPFCHACPFGADCSSGGDRVRAMPGFWGCEQGAGCGGAAGDAPGTALLFQCPDGFCCPFARGTCPLYWCAGNRQGTLCGECQPGYSRTLNTPQCVPSQTCNDSW